MSESPGLLRRIVVRARSATPGEAIKWLLIGWPLWWLLGIDQLILPVFAGFLLVRACLRRQGEWHINLPIIGAALIVVWWGLPIFSVHSMSHLLREWSIGVLHLAFMLLAWNSARDDLEADKAHVLRGIEWLSVAFIVAGLLPFIPAFRGELPTLLGKLLPASVGASSSFVHDLRTVRLVGGESLYFPFRLTSLSEHATALCFAALLFTAVWAWRVRAEGWNAINALGLAGSLYLLAFAESRLGYVAFAAGLAVYLILEYMQSRYYRRRWFYAGGMIATLGGILLAITRFDVLRQLFDMAFVQNRPGSFWTRLRLYRDTLPYLLERPIAGWGETLANPGGGLKIGTHSAPLGVLMQHGVVGLLLTVLLWAGVLVLLVRLYKTACEQRTDARFGYQALLAGLVALLLRAVFDGIWWAFEDAAVLWGVFLLVIWSARAAGLAPLGGWHESMSSFAARLSTRYVADGDRSASAMDGALLAGITLLAGVLRFYRLTYQSLILDEISTFADATSSIQGIVTLTSTWQNHPPGIYILYHYFLQAFGASEFTLRFLPALCGTLVIPAIFLLGRRLASTRVGLIAALLITFTETAIYYSQQARSYSIVLLVTIISFLLWHRIYTALLAHEGTPLRLRLGYVLVSLIGSQLHYAFLLILLVQGVQLLASAVWDQPARRVFLRQLAPAYAIILAGINAWLLVVARKLSSPKESSLKWIPAITLDDIRHFQHAYYGSFGALWLVELAIVVIVAIVLISVLASNSSRDRAVQRFQRVELVLFVWLLLPMAAFVAYSLLVKPAYAPRYVLFSLPASVLLVARSIDLSFSSTRRGLWATVLLMVTVLAGTLVQDGYYTTITKTQYREALAYVYEHTQGEPMFGHYFRSAEASFYLERFGSDAQLQGSFGREGDLPELCASLSERNAERFWFLKLHEPLDPAFEQQLLSEFIVLDDQPFYGTRVLFLETRPTSCP